MIITLNGYVVLTYFPFFNLLGTSRGPSPITLGSQDSLPVATAFTESVNAYFKGADPSKYVEHLLYLNSFS